MCTCAHDAEEWEDNVKREFGQQNVPKERLGVIKTFRNTNDRNVSRP